MSSYIKKLFDVKGHLYAATTYLQRLGNPKSIAELNNANFIDFEKSGRLLSLLNSQGFNLSSHNFPVVTKSHIVQWNCDGASSETMIFLLLVLLLSAPVPPRPGRGLSLTVHVPTVVWSEDHGLSCRSPNRHIGL